MYKVKVNNKYDYELEFKDKKSTKGTINGENIDWDVLTLREKCDHFNVIRNNNSFNVSVLESDYEEKKFIVSVAGNIYTVDLKDRYDLLLKNLGLENALQTKITDIKAPMPGLVLDINVKEGDEVKKGDKVLVLEAMKMENVIKSPTDGIIKSITVKHSQAVDKNQVLITFK